MKTTTLLFVLGLSATVTSGQVITKLHQGTSTFYYNVDDLVNIVAGASANDTIILPGGPMNLAGSLLIDKRIVIVGAGVLASGTPVTGISTVIGTNVGGFQEYVTITSAGAGSSLHGIEFQAPVRFYGSGMNAPSFTASFNRCRFVGSLSLGEWSSPIVYPAASNVYVKHCIFLNGISSAGSTAPQGFVADNCYIQGGVSFGSQISSAFINQCVLFNMTTISGQNPGAVFTNNIFTRNLNSYTLNSASVYNNNLFAMGGAGNTLIWSGAIDGGGNVGVQAQAIPVFMSIASYASYSAADNYHYAANSPAIGMGQGGYSVGTYGGPASLIWKEDAIPFNPHWFSLSPSLGSTNGGLISISLSGAAQQD